VVRRVLRLPFRCILDPAPWDHGIDVKEMTQTAKRRRKGHQLLKYRTETPDVDNGQALWNLAERAERRSNARVAREYEFALPDELSSADRISLTRKSARIVADRYLVAVDTSIHAANEDGGFESTGVAPHLWQQSLGSQSGLYRWSIANSFLKPRELCEV
jgi:MobA/MobL family protein